MRLLKPSSFSHPTIAATSPEPNCSWMVDLRKYRVIGAPAQALQNVPQGKLPDVDCRSSSRVVVLLEPQVMGLIESARPKEARVEHEHEGREILTAVR